MKKTTERILFAMTLIAGSVVGATAGIPEAREAIKRKDVDFAIVELRPLALEGSTEAQLLLARVLYATRTDSAGLLEALGLFRLAANAGNEDAMLTLALIYDRSEKVVQDQKEVVKWLTLLAERNNVMGAMTLSKKYDEGQGVPQSHVISHALVAFSGFMPDVTAQAAEESFGDMTLGQIAGLVDEMRKPNNFQKALEKANAEAVLFNKKYGNLPNSVKARVVDAEAGDVKSIIKIGSLYLWGHSRVPRDPKLAAHWFQKAASLGDPIGRDFMANLYLEGEGVKKDYKAAYKLFTELAKEKRPAVEGKLGVMYKDGLGVTQDFAKAHYWLRKSVGTVGQNLYGLAQMYAVGAGVERSPVVAYALARRSAESNPTEFGLGKPAVENPAIALARDIRRNLSPYEVAVGAALSRQLLNASVNDGNQLELIDAAAAKRGDIYAISPTKVAQHFVYSYEDEDLPLALKLLEPLLERNDPEAQYLMGSLYRQGKGVTKSVERANSLLDLAVGQGNADALAYKGYMYEYGDGVPQDLLKAFGAYESAAKQGNESAQVSLAEMLANGKGVVRNTSLATYWFDQSLKISKNSSRSGAYKGLAKIHQDEQRFSEAARNLKKAAALSDKEAQLSLANMYFEGLGVRRNVQLAFVLAQIVQRNESQKEKAIAFEERLKDFLPPGAAKALEPLVVGLSNLDRYSGAVEKDVDKFFSVLEEAESTLK